MRMLELGEGLIEAGENMSDTVVDLSQLFCGEFWFYHRSISCCRRGCRDQYHQDQHQVHQQVDHPEVRWRSSRCATECTGMSAGRSLNSTHRFRRGPLTVDNWTAQPPFWLVQAKILESEIKVLL